VTRHTRYFFSNIDLEVTVIPVSSEMLFPSIRLRNYLSVAAAMAAICRLRIETRVEGGI
jgi:hypothetical protein